MQETEPLNSGALARELKILNLERSPEAVEELIMLFSSHGVVPVQAFRELTSPENLGLIQQMCRMTGGEPSR